MLRSTVVTHPTTSSLGHIIDRQQAHLIRIIITAQRYTPTFVTFMHQQVPQPRHYQFPTHPLRWDITLRKHTDTARTKDAELARDVFAGVIYVLWTNGTATDEIGITSGNSGKEGSNQVIVGS